MVIKMSDRWKKILVTVAVFTATIAVLLFLTSCRSNNQQVYSCCAGAGQISSASGGGNNTAGENETIVETTDSQGRQIIEVVAGSGGYSPKKIQAKAGVPTILIMKSVDAYGCERAFNLPDLNLGKILPENGQTQFDLGAQTEGTKLLGVCSMGMYYFQIFFS